MDRTDRIIERVSLVLVAFMCLYLVGHLIVASHKGSLWDSQPEVSVIED